MTLWLPQWNVCTAQPVPTCGACNFDVFFVLSIKCHKSWACNFQNFQSSHTSVIDRLALIDCSFSNIIYRYKGSVNMGLVCRAGLMKQGAWLHYNCLFKTIWHNHRIPSHVKMCDSLAMCLHMAPGLGLGSVVIIRVR